MMGPPHVAQGALFYEFSVEDHVLGGHPLRRNERFGDIPDIGGFLAPC